MDLRSERDPYEFPAARPARLYGRIAGLLLLLLGIGGGLVAMRQDGTGAVLGIEMNLTHGVLLLLAAAGSIVASYASEPAARLWAVALGAVFLAFGLWGLMAGQPFDPFDAFGNINTGGSWLHVAIGVSGIVAAAVSISEESRWHGPN